MEEKTLRDEIAMSMPMEVMPAVPGNIKEVFEEFGIEADLESNKGLVTATMEFTAICRYMYADAMLKVKNKGI
jgi:hypothetical protein